MFPIHHFVSTFILSVLFPRLSSLCQVLPFVLWYQLRWLYFNACKFVDQNDTDLVMSQ